jgi:DNA-binding MarR family transcriptional regulator
MVNDDQQQQYSEQLSYFLQYLNDILGRLTSLMPEELDQFLDRLEVIQPKNEFYLVTNPVFHNMSNILYHNKNLTMGELSHVLSVPLSTATRMVDWWVNNGYATRLSDPEDRRIVRVALTDSGRRLHEIVDLYIVQSVQKALSCLTAEEQDSLLTLIRKVAIGLKQAKK